MRNSFWEKFVLGRGASARVRTRILTQWHFFALCIQTTCINKRICQLVNFDCGGYSHCLSSLIMQNYILCFWARSSFLIRSAGIWELNDNNKWILTEKNWMITAQFGDICTNARDWSKLTSSLIIWSAEYI